MRNHEEENGTVTAEQEVDEEDDDEDENLTATMPNSFPLPSPPLNNSSFTLLERLEKIVPRNILEVLRTVNPDGNEFHPETETSTTSTTAAATTADTSASPWSNIDRVPSPSHDETLMEDSQQAKKLYLLGKNV